MNYDTLSGAAPMPLLCWAIVVGGLYFLYWFNKKLKKLWYESTKIKRDIFKTLIDSWFKGGK